MSRKALLAGLAAVTAGFALIGMSLASNGGGATAFAGEEPDECVTYTPTRTYTHTPMPSYTSSVPTNTPAPTNTAVGQIQSFGNQTPQRTCVNTATPTKTPTLAATSTLVPNTAVPTSPPVVATATPSGGSQGGGVQPPNTGSGDAGSTGIDSTWFLLAGAALIVVGGGSVLAGARRRS